MAVSPWNEDSLPQPVIALEESFDGFLDLEWLELTPELARVRFELRDNLKQPLGLLHGGIYSAVAESVASMATIHAIHAEGLAGSGLSNYASFLRPVTSGRVDVTARLRHRTEREWLWGHDFTDERGNLCALVDVVIAVRPVPR